MRYYWRVLKWNKGIEVDYTVADNEEGFEIGDMRYDLTPEEFTPIPPESLEEGYAVTSEGFYCRFKKQYDDGEWTGTYYIYVLDLAYGSAVEDLTGYAVVPVFINEKANETLDSGEIILEGMPISRRTAFQPKTKFRVERYTTPDHSDTPERWDMIVDHDDVEEYPTCPDVCTHRVTLIEASAVTQGMHCDNIALTYELQDVDLNYRTTLPDSGTVTTIKETVGSPYNAYTNGGPSNTGWHNNLMDGNSYMGQNYHRATRKEPVTSYYNANYKFEWDKTNIFNNIPLFINASSAQTYTVEMPRLKMSVGTGSAWGFVCDVPIRATVTYRKYKQRARQNENGEYVKITSATAIDIGGGTVTDVVSYPSANSTFTAYSYRTKVENNAVYICQSSMNNWLLHRSDNAFILTAKWIGPGSGKDDDYTTYVKVSEKGENKQHIDSFTFTTLTMADSEAIFTENGEMYVSWYEYTIQIREAIYLCLTRNVPYLQNLVCNGYWLSLGGDIWEFNRKWVTDTLYLTSKADEAPQVYLKTAFNVSINVKDKNVGAYLVRPNKYSGLNMLYKALLTIDTQIVNNSTTGIEDLPSRFVLDVDNEWKEKLNSITLNETIFEQKNLWEILLQIGYYLHAIPYLEFTDDGTDRFVLKFEQLGRADERDDTGAKITIFNSRNLSNFFTQYDAYVTNFYSPQNVVEEWLVAKTSDNSYLTSNDTAEFQTAKPILEVLEFDYIYNGVKKDGKDSIFEQSIYQILTSDNPKAIKPAKGNSIYYKIGENKIQGLNYVPPQVHSGTYLYALQEICSRLYGSSISNPEELKFNSLTVHIKYRTQDDLRVTQVRPDLLNFIKNSTYEQYPHHEQFYGQQDKIVDSERFTENLFGKLIRVGNAEYQTQEYVDTGSEMRPGELVMIGDEPYYVTETENEYYNDAILQKVTYSKNFNQLSQVVTIPSEPRFYEISERSKVRREVRLMDFLELSSQMPRQYNSTRFVDDLGWHKLVSGALFNKTAYRMPNYAYTRFEADKRRAHINSQGFTIPSSELFPSSDAIKIDSGIFPRQARSFSTCIVPLLHYPTKNSIVFEWDMEDNFKAGDFIDTSIYGTNDKGEAYFSQQACRYADVMGRADLFTFRLFYRGKVSDTEDTSWTHEEAQSLPKTTITRVSGATFTETDITPTQEESAFYLPEPYRVALDKDNREAISFNYQINLLHRATSFDNEGFITLSNLFGEKEGALKMCFLGKTQNMFDQNINSELHHAEYDNVQYQLYYRQNINAVEIKITAPLGCDLSRVKAIALYEEAGGGRYAYIIKNVAQKSNSSKLNSWWIYPANTM